MKSETNLSIALAFSGGGFRAASFSLGTLSYLNRIRTENGTLLDQVNILSTISGGTITGARYAIGVKKGEEFAAIYKVLYQFMSEVDLITLALDRLISTEGWGDNRLKSLINAVSDIYDQYLFDRDKFGVLMDENNPIHLKHITFNSTEFVNALHFRFQQTEKIINPTENEPERGLIGNYYFQIPPPIARELRMADIVAASSCFPGGFEPINFPDDFILPEGKETDDFKKSIGLSIGLMDGGIVDNQGIEPVILAEARISRNELGGHVDPSERDNTIDLFIITDVAAPSMEERILSVQKKSNWWRILSLRKIEIGNTSMLLIFLLGLAVSIYRHYIYLAVICTFLSTLSLGLFIITRLVIKLPVKFDVPEFFLKPIGKFGKLRFAVYENMIMNRFSSLLKLTSKVFMKHVRRLNYQRIFKDNFWKNRRIMHAIYELREGEKSLKHKIDNKIIKEDLIPSHEIRKVAGLASQMDTTLWFTEQQIKKENMLNSIIACGQFGLCWNLIEYIENLKKTLPNPNQKQQQLIACEKQLLEDWFEFQKKPLWLVEEINQLSYIEQTKP